MAAFAQQSFAPSLHILGGAYFAAAGFIALHARLKQTQLRRREAAAAAAHGRRANIALLAIGAPFLPFWIWAAVTSLLADFRAPETITGRLAEVRAYRDGPLKLRLEGSEKALPWKCGIICRGREEVLLLTPGTPLEMKVLNHQIVGLRSRDAVLLDPTVERRRLVVRDGLFLAFGLAAIVGAILMVRGWIQTERSRYRPPDASTAQAYRGLSRSRSPGQDDT